jgi:hypothetical protein
MEPTLEHRIRQRAYEIWDARGRADGSADEHWLAAEREVLSSLCAPSPAADVKSPPTPAERMRASRRAVGQRAARSNKPKS